MDNFTWYKSTKNIHPICNAIVHSLWYGVEMNGQTITEQVTYRKEVF